MTWREAFALLQIEVEEKIGAIQRQRIAEFNAAQDAASAGLRAVAEAAGE